VTEAPDNQRLQPSAAVANLFVPRLKRGLRQQGAIVDAGTLGGLLGAGSGVLDGVVGRYFSIKNTLDGANAAYCGAIDVSRLFAATRGQLRVHGCRDFSPTGPRG